jgi:hypothetical protein
MTTLSSEDVTCCICGESSNHTAISSTNQFGSPDLDTRPAEMMRSTINYWVQRCPSCCYCAPDLSECNPGTKGIVESQEYQDILNNDAIPEIAASFLALSYEKQQSQQYSVSVWRAIHAAWICDDKDNSEASKECRIKAISLIEKAESHSQTIANQTGASEAITIDLMRRTGMLQKALELVENTKAKDIEDVIRKVITFEETLIRNKDNRRHTVSEALGDQ